MRRRPHASPAPLTSLLDVLFILLFASLVQSAAAAEEATPAEEGSGAPSTLHARAIDEWTARLRAAPAVFAYVQEGVLRSLELSFAAETRRYPGAWALTHPSSDPDIGLSYVGEGDPERRLCAIIAASFPEVELGSAMVVISTDLPLEKLPVALVEGLRRDQQACAESGAATVIVPGREPDRGE